MPNSLPFAVHEALDRHPLTITPDTPASVAIRLMSQVRASCVLVVDSPPQGAIAHSSIIGIFTERDVVLLTAANIPIEGVAIAQVMTKRPFTLLASEVKDILGLLNLFRKNRFRHLPIIDDQGILLGLLTHQTIREALKPVDWMRLRRVAEVMTTQVIHSPPSASILDVTELMAQNRVSCVIITEQVNPISSFSCSVSLTPQGIITERDIVQYRALELDFHATKAQTVMSTPLLPIKAQDSLIVAHEIMRKHRIRRLVVLGEAGELVGTITQTSLLQALDPIEVDASIVALQEVIEERTTELLQTNQQLEIEIQQRQQTQAALELSQTRLAGILNTAEDGIISVDEQLRVQLFNQGAEKIFGYQAFEVLYQPIDLLLPAGFTKAHRQHIFKLNESSDVTQPEIQGRREIWLRRKDKTEFPAEASISKLVVGEETVWTMILRDISNRVQAEEAQRHQMARERLMATIALRIRQSLDIDTILSTTVAEVRQFLVCDRVIIYRFEPDWSGIVAVESVGPGWRSILGSIIQDQCFAQNYLEHYKQGRIEAIEDIYTANINQCRIDLLTPLQVRANLVVPIITQSRTIEDQGSVISLTGGFPNKEIAENDPFFSPYPFCPLPPTIGTTGPKLWGLLAAHQCSRSRNWQQWEIDLLKQLATQVAIALQQAELYQQLVAANRQLLQLACLDGLTQVANRRRFDEYLNQEWRRLLREQQALSLILCDVDFFKAYNDTYGHLAGDFCLQQVANAIRQALKRPADLVARYGGEEFAIILPNTPIPGAFHVAEQIRTQIVALKVEHPKSLVNQYITVSLGIATTIPNYQSSPAKLIAVADEALYQAKAQGRNVSITQTF